MINGKKHGVAAFFFFFLLLHVLVRYQDLFGRLVGWFSMSGPDYLLRVITLTSEKQWPVKEHLSCWILTFVHPYFGYLGLLNGEGRRIGSIVIIPPGQDIYTRRGGLDEVWRRYE